MRDNDVASVMEFKAMPIPPERRVFVFLAFGDTPEMRAEWGKWGGKSEFCESPDGCGIALFSFAGWYAVPRSWVSRLLPFFEAAGSEANVFEYRPVEKNFVRRTRDWFEVPDRILAY